VASSPPLNLGESRPRNQEERRKKTVAKVAAMLATPITFYGKVVDQNGEPIPGANVDYGTIDKFDESGSDYQSKSDENGGFSITGINGAVLTVGVRKEGYYNIHGKSDAAFAYGVGVDPTRKAPPTKDNPAMFVLQRIGVTEPLLHIASRQYRMSKSGEPIEIDLKTGNLVAPGTGNLRLERWANDRNKDTKGHFDWGFRITAPQGGLAERKEQFAFEAPQEGYTEKIEIKMPASVADTWSYAINRSYFVVMRDHYALIKLDIYSGHDNAVLLEAFVNPTGSRNLEFDPAKVVKHD